MADRGSAAAVADELAIHRLAAAADEMGIVLERLAISLNIKDRKDFSCAILDSRGFLVANAPHVPVHLGAIGPCVRAVAETLDIGPGDAVLTNHPAYGGSHLPDLTVIQALFASDGRRLAWLANRAHHAEIGGRTPGSMPIDATCLTEEGVVLEPMKIVEGGVFRSQLLRSHLESGPWPSRAVADNLADIEAQIAANHRGARALERLVARWGEPWLENAFATVLEVSAAAVRRALRAFDGHVVELSDTLEDGHPLALRLEVQGARLRISWRGSGPLHPGNLNAPEAVTRAALVFVIRLLIDDEVPLSEGLLQPVELEIEAGSFLDPSFVAEPADCPAIFGGNVEISQRLADMMIQAFGLAAGSQATMNNLTLGGLTFSLYETLGGGAGAGPGFDGASASQVLMTNTAATDPEVLERRMPVRIRRFGRRMGSGGHGEYRGGDGLIREIEVLEQAEACLLGGRRNQAPPGCNAAEGLSGRQLLIRSGGAEEVLPWRWQGVLEPGDRLRLETPGGGGWSPGEDE